MEFKNITKNSNMPNDDSSLQQELDKIDNIIDNNFHSRKDNSLNNDKKIINNIKLYFFHDDLNFEDKHQKQINKLLSIIGNNYKNNHKQSFKPLKEPKKVSLIGKIFVNNEEINSNNNNELNIDKNKDLCSGILIKHL